MTDAEIRAVVLRVLGRIAPEANLASVDARTPLREQLDLDSVDFVNLLIGLADALGVEIPEADYTQVLTLDGCVRYLVQHGATRKEPAA